MGQSITWATWEASIAAAMIAAGQQVALDLHPDRLDTLMYEWDRRQIQAGKAHRVSPGRRWLHPDIWPSGAARAA